MVESRLRKIFENIENGKIQNLFIFFLFEEGFNWVSAVVFI